MNITRRIIILALLTALAIAATADLNGPRAYGHPVYTKQHVDYHMIRYQQLIGSQARTNRVLRRQTSGVLATSVKPWVALAFCETGNRWSYNGSSDYDGGIQFDPGTWRAYGGRTFADYAWQATPIQQVAIGQKLLAATSKRDSWPECTKKNAW